MKILIVSILIATVGCSQAKIPGRWTNDMSFEFIFNYGDGGVYSRTSISGDSLYYTLEKRTGDNLSFQRKLKTEQLNEFLKILSENKADKIRMKKLNGVTYDGAAFQMQLKKNNKEIFKIIHDGTNVLKDSDVPRYRAIMNWLNKWK